MGCGISVQSLDPVLGEEEMNKGVSLEAIKVIVNVAGSSFVAKAEVETKTEEAFEIRMNWNVGCSVEISQVIRPGEIVPRYNPLVDRNPPLHLTYTQRGVTYSNTFPTTWVNNTIMRKQQLCSWHTVSSRANKKDNLFYHSTENHKKTLVRVKDF